MSTNQAEMAEQWQEQSAKLHKLDQSKLSSSFSKEVFNLSDHNLRCIDEGTPGGVHIAGSGILLEMDEAKKYAKNAAVDGVFSHAECGAAKMYAESENLEPEFADDYGKEWAKSLAEHLGVPYRGHLEIGKMNRPGGFHNAVLAYYDGTGKFNYSADDKLPAGFVISRKYLDPEYAKKELDIAISIALGSHGFGNLFNEKTPFVIIAISEKGSELTLSQLESEVREAAAKYGNRVETKTVEVEI